jgi:hypothetical protein
MRNVHPLSIDEICEFLNIDRDVFYKFVEVKEFSNHHLDCLRSHNYTESPIQAINFNPEKLNSEILAI